MAHKITSTQPQPVRQKIYGTGVPVAPLNGPSDQPANVKGTRVYGQRTTPAIRVRLKDADREMVIEEKDFDPDRHERLD